jgi:hypothetical protein
MATDTRLMDHREFAAALQAPARASRTAAAGPVDDFSADDAATNVVTVIVVVGGLVIGAGAAAFVWSDRLAALLR